MRSARRAVSPSLPLPNRSLSLLRTWKSSAVRAQLRAAPRRRSTISISRSCATSGGRSTERSVTSCTSLSHAFLSLSLYAQALSCEFLRFSKVAPPLRARGVQRLASFFPRGLNSRPLALPSALRSRSVLSSPSSPRSRDASNCTNGRSARVRRV